MSISLGIITERLQHYGGSEIYILECIRRWQKELDIVIYTTRCNRKLLKEFGIDQDKVSVKILPRVKIRKHRFELLDDLVVRPRIWEQHVGHHDLYFQYLFPAQLVRKCPSIWFAAEPLRMLYDLRHQESMDGSKTSFHIYPRMRYESAIKSDLNVVLQIIHELDRNSKIETLVTNSRMMEGYLETVYGRKADLIAYPGINLPEIYHGPMDNHTALFVGRLWHHKRIDLIIKAISMVPLGKLIIVGDGPEKTKLKKLVKSLELKRRVRFIKNLSNEQLSQMYLSVSCGVYTPLREPFGIMPIEAASYGLPVVVTEDGGYTEVLDASCAHIVAPEPQRIAEAMDSLFSDHAAARRMGAAARKKVERFTWDNTAHTLLQLFKKTLINQRRVINNPGLRPLLGAHYYLWYRAGEEKRHWNENTDYATVTDLPMQGVYSSVDRNVISKHLTWIEQAGLDYLVINLQVSSDGLDKGELKALDLLFEMAAENNPELSLSVMLSCDNTSSKSIDATLNLVEERYISRSNYLLLDAKPVLWYFISESFIGHFYHRFSALIASTRKYHCVAASGFAYTKNLPRHYGEFFAGWTLYSPLQISASKKWEDLWKSSYRDFIEDASGKALRVFTICPGFDDTGLTHLHRSNADFRKIRRAQTKTFTRMQQACVDLKDLPDLVVITSFNEFHENTHIEPSEKFGHQYIEMTHRFSEQLKSGGGRDPRQRSTSPKARRSKYSQVLS